MDYKNLEEYLEKQPKRTWSEDYYEVRYWWLPGNGGLGTVSKHKTLDEATAKAKELQAQDDISEYGKRHTYFICHKVETTTYENFKVE